MGLLVNFGTSLQSWLGLQSGYDLDMAADEIGGRLRHEGKVRAKTG